MEWAESQILKGLSVAIQNSIKFLIAQVFLLTWIVVPSTFIFVLFFFRLILPQKTVVVSALFSKLN